MKTPAAMERNAQLRKHQKEMRQSADRHEIEMGKIKNMQQKQKNEAQLSHRTEIQSLRNNHDRKLQETLMKNEEVLTKLRTNLDDVKAQVADEKRNIQMDHQAHRDAKKKLHSVELQTAQHKANMSVVDINEEANFEMQKLQRKIDEKEREVKNSHGQEMLLAKDSHKKKMNMTRNTFQMKQTNEQDKFQNALLKQKETHSKQLTGNERKHHKRVKARTEQYQSEIQKITDDGNRKKAQKTKSFEKDFALLNKKQEIILKNLVGRKEELIHNLKADLTKEYKLGLEKGKDPFYKFGRIDAKLSELPDKSGYTVKVPISNHEADKVEMRAEKRQLRITMERRYEFQKNDKDSLDKVSKVESFVSKIPVKNIVDPKSITKEYSNGNLVFTIKNA